MNLLDESLRQSVQAAVDRLDCVLPGQAPILNFVARNKLQNFQNMPFAEALAFTEKLTGIRGYPPEEEFRQFYQAHRINDADLMWAFSQNPELSADEVLLDLPGQSIRYADIYKIAMIYGIEAISPSQLNWQIDEFQALNRFQADVPKDKRLNFLNLAKSMGHEISGEVIHDLWNACLTVLGLDHYRLHPEELTDLSLAQVESILAEFEVGVEEGCSFNPGIHQKMRDEVRLQFDAFFAPGSSLRSLLMKLTGFDLLDEVKTHLIRFCASQLDEGVAAWHLPDDHQGLYAAWRRCSAGDLGLSLADIDWRKAHAELPESAVDAVIFELRQIGMPESAWEDYLKSIALELPGWSGMINWRQQNPNYVSNRQKPVASMDYLAIRLFLDRMWVQQICRDFWGIAGRFNAICDYFSANLSEFMARSALFQGTLPEYLAAKVQRLLALSWSERMQHESWTTLADMIWTWQHSPVAEKTGRHTVYRSAWRLFRLSQHLGLSSEILEKITLNEVQRLLDALDALNDSQRGYCWLLAYEHHYREDLFNVLVQNHGAGRFAQRNIRPTAQVMFCMDDREESIRRHLEEINPLVETLGAAGFFGVAMNWRGIDDEKATALCPVVVTPSHEVQECFQAPEEECIQHKRRHTVKAWLSRLFNQEIRRNLLSSQILIDALAPVVLGVLSAKIFFPRQQAEWTQKFAKSWIPPIPTRLSLNALDEILNATPEKPRFGFTDDEQADRVANLLRMTGLTTGLAPLAVLMGHGSTSQNNPHFAAYDCGACSGRHGGPNARAFAAMANRSQVRLILKGRGLDIPEDTWFLGAEHDTCSEAIIWYDLDDMPPAFKPAFDRLKADIDESCRYSAHERCRRLASAPIKPSLEAALKHVIGRSVDFSQARPELGHATNAAAVIGRRAVTQGIFLDRRAFLISYDASLDLDGKIIEGILLAAGPVGAGINLEYFFSRVNNDRYGSSSKVTQNVTGLVGVMEGANSDLRHGLPRQMIEIHEPMRLQFIVEAKTDILTQVYQRQTVLQELIGNGWAHFSAIDPDNGEISVFQPGVGFVPWKGEKRAVSHAQRSTDWYAGHTETVKPAFIGRKGVESC